MPQQLASFPGPKTGRRYSAVVLDRSQARPALRCFSVPECWAGAGNEATLVLLGYLSSCSSSTPCFLLCPGLTQPVLFLVCCFNSTGHCHIQFYRFLFEAPLLFAWVISRTRLYHINDPRSFTNYSLDLLCMLWEHGCEKYMTS